MSTAAGMQGEPADAFMLMARARHIPTIKWIDDACHHRHPIARDADGSFIYSYDLTSIQQQFSALGIPWHPTKRAELADEVVYVGFRWNLKLKTVGLPEHKRLKYVGKVLDFRRAASSGRVSLRDLYSIIGTLSHVTFVYREGRAYLPALSKCAAAFGGAMFQRRFLSARALSDLKWWAELLQQPGLYRSLQPRSPPVDPGIWVDASTSWGIGLMFGSSWDAWRLRDGWNTHGRDIGWAEAVGLELTLMAMRKRDFHDTDVLVHGDNTGSIGAHAKGRSRNEHVNEVLRRMHWIGRAENIVVHPEYVQSALNLADALSRGVLGPKSSWADFSFDLPAELVPFLEHVSL